MSYVTNDALRDCARIIAASISELAAAHKALADAIASNKQGDADV